MNEQSESIDEIKLGKGLMSLAELLPEKAKRSFYNDAQSYVNNIPSGMAVMLREFEGPYNLLLDYDPKTQNILLNFSGSNDCNNKSNYKVPFGWFIDRILHDRSQLSDREVLYNQENPSVIVSFERKYNLQHAANAMKLQQSFRVAGLSGKDLDFFKSLYAILRFAVPTNPSADAEYLKKYVSLFSN